MIFDTKNWLWKSEFCNLQGQIHLAEKSLRLYQMKRSCFFGQGNLSVYRAYSIIYPTNQLAVTRQITKHFRIFEILMQLKKCVGSIVEELSCHPFASGKNAYCESPLLIVLFSPCPLSMTRTPLMQHLQISPYTQSGDTCTNAVLLSHLAKSLFMTCLFNF